jgi:radical SAM protein with 4Fe4S-binding SPASM domain
MEAGRKAEYELSTKECLALVDEMKHLGTEMLILTGGEPLMRKDIFEIARYASEQEMWVVMGTNGVLVTEKVAQKMVECGVKGVAVSIDSIDADKHNQFRGGPNSWEYSVKALKICRNQGLQVLVQTTITESNYEEIPQLIEFTRELGAWSFNLYFLVQTGRGQQMNDLSPQRTQTMLEKLVTIQDSYRPMLVRSKCAPQFKQIAYEMGLGGLESGGCMAGTEYCRITPEGNVTPCPYMTVVAGNVLESGFKEVWQSSPVLQELRDLQKLKGRCGRCEFKELCGGCRCRAYAAFDDYLQEDPACIYQPNGNLELPKTENVIWTETALARLNRIPIAFIRSKVKKGVEAFARRQGKNRITSDLMKEALAGEERTGMFGNMPSFFNKL